jgi:hypothetical protein
MSVNKFTVVSNTLKAESKKHRWIFTELKANAFQNPTISCGVRVSAPSLSWDIFYDDIRKCALLQTGAIYDFAQQEPSQIARSIAQDTVHLNAEREELH